MEFCAQTASYWEIVRAFFAAEAVWGSGYHWTAQRVCRTCPAAGTGGGCWLGETGKTTGHTAQ